MNLDLVVYSPHLYFLDLDLLFPASLIRFLTSCRDVLRVKRTDLFQRWVFNFGHRLIIEATKYVIKDCYNNEN